MFGLLLLFFFFPGRFIRSVRPEAGRERQPGGMRVGAVARRGAHLPGVAPRRGPAPGRGIPVSQCVPATPLVWKTRFTFSYPLPRIH